MTTTTKAARARVATLAVVAAIPQVDGGTRYLLDTPAEARRMRTAIRRDPATIEGSAPEVILDVDADGRMVCVRWPGGPPPWAAIGAALAAD